MVDRTVPINEAFKGSTATRSYPRQTRPAPRMLEQTWFVYAGNRSSSNNRTWWCYKRENG